MPKVKFKTNIAGYYDIRRMPSLVAELERHGRRIMDKANFTLGDREGYRMSSQQRRKGPPPAGSKGKGYQGRWAVRVYTATAHAKRSNARNNTLVKLLSESR